MRILPRHQAKRGVGADQYQRENTSAFKIFDNLLNVLIPGGWLNGPRCGMSETEVEWTPLWNVRDRGCYPLVSKLRAVFFTHLQSLDRSAFCPNVKSDISRVLVARKRAVRSGGELHLSATPQWHRDLQFTV
jgi:hypothetical protein